MNDDARRRPSIQSMGSADRLEVMRAKLLYAIANTDLMDADFLMRQSDGWEGIGN